MNRLTLVPGLRRLWRDPQSIQFGIDPAIAVIVELPDPRFARVLELLDGSRNERAVLRDAAAIGVGPADAAEMIAGLRMAGVLTSADAILPPNMPETARRHLATEAAALSARPRPIGEERPVDLSSAGGPGMSGPGLSGPGGPGGSGGLGGSGRPSGSGLSGSGGLSSADCSPAEVLARRAAATVSVIGTIRLAVPIGAALAASGIGHVDVSGHGRVRAADTVVGGLSWADVDRPRATAAGDALRRASPTADTRGVRAGTASFVVQVGPGAPAQLAAHAFALRALAHLAVEERDATILVGPLVPPGGSPCLNCLDLHRRDRDPAWPAIVAQLATTPDAPATTSTATALIAVGVACGQILAYVDGAQTVATIGGNIEISGTLDLRRRSWDRHPRCHCGTRASLPRARRRPQGGQRGSAMRQASTG